MSLPALPQPHELLSEGYLGPSYSLASALNGSSRVPSQGYNPIPSQALCRQYLLTDPHQPLPPTPPVPCQLLTHHFPGHLSTGGGGQTIQGGWPVSPHHIHHSPCLPELMSCAFPADLLQEALPLGNLTQQRICSKLRAPLTLRYSSWSLVLSTSSSHFWYRDPNPSQYIDLSSCL